MKNLFLALAASVALVGVAHATQQPQRRAGPILKVAKTGYIVQINTAQANLFPSENPSMGPIIVVARCNATVDRKDLEGWVSETTAATVLDMVASQSGTERQSITFVVPWGWNYYIRVAQQPSGSGLPPGGICRATAWWTN